MFEVKIAQEVAQDEVEKLLDLKRIMPLKRKDLAKPIEILVQAISLGYAVVDEKGMITQTLVDPVLDTSSNPVLEKLEYKARLDPTTVNKRISELKAGSNQSVLLTCYASIATGQPSGIINKLDSTDRDTCDAICALFL